LALSWQDLAPLQVDELQPQAITPSAIATLLAWRAGVHPVDRASACKALLPSHRRARAQRMLNPWRRRGNSRAQRRDFTGAAARDFTGAAARGLCWRSDVTGATAREFTGAAARNVTGATAREFADAAARGLFRAQRRGTSRAQRRGTSRAAWDFPWRSGAAGAAAWLFTELGLRVHRPPGVVSRKCQRARPGWIVLAMIGDGDRR
jgi:hypothetical protein